MSKLVRIERRGGVVWVQPEGTHFLRVDLEVFGRTRLTALAEALGESGLCCMKGDGAAATTPVSSWPTRGSSAPTRRSDDS